MVTDEPFIAETAVWPIYFPINIITAFSFLFASAAGAVPCSGRKDLPVHRPKQFYILVF